MLQLNTNAMALADNRIDINGVNIGTFTDDEAQKILDIARGMLNERNSHVSAPAPAPSTAAPVAPTVYDHVDADFTDVAWHVNDNVVTYTHKDGKYVFEKAVRNVLNARIKASGAKYDEGLKGWAFMNGTKRDMKGAKAFADTASTIVSASELNAVYDKWTAKSAKKAEKKA